MEEAVVGSANQGSDKSFTLNLAALSAGEYGKSKPRTVIFTKRIAAEELLFNPFARMSPEDNFLRGSSVSVVVPPESTDLEVEIVGEQSGKKVSEKIISSGTAERALLVSVYTLPHELTSGTDSLPLGVDLYAPIDDSEEIKGKRKGVTGEEDEQIQLFSIDPVDGTIALSKRLRTGREGTGMESVGSVEGTVRFASQKGSDEESAYVQGDDGSLKPFPLPPSSSWKTVADGPGSRVLYALNRKENLLLIYQRASDGTLQEIERLSTGPDPIALATVPQASLLVVAEYEGRTLSTFTIDAEGKLALYQTVATEANPLAMAVDPQGRFLYLSEANRTISQFQIGGDRTLTLLRRVDTPTTVTTMRMDPLGAVLSTLTYSASGCSGEVRCKSLMKHKKLWRRYRRAVVSIVIQATVVAGVSVVTCGTFQVWKCAAAIGYAQGVNEVCKDSWRRGNACYGYRREWKF